MKWPKTIRIGYRTVRLIWDSPLGTALANDQGAALAGCARHVSGEMFLATGMDRQEQASTVLHELIHLVLKQSAQDQWEQEERVVSALASGPAQAMQDNPKLWRQIAKALKKKRAQQPGWWKTPA
uniref:SprT-like domain-containing protein n=1 Tax=viral metagenome TaxID=1070528 RepID=A0A6M3KKA3_9ZZZZ